eukprot:CAMPEP_0172709620 /NCGR_PEP_ID=MMETSP1074-20121228/55174_1 /TAXON_ID=2916 /ORGANISM="Ceratium fusus, Strain PA161109" /LENGTH=81 /DNA_ID=CAMNT_0013532903 /DNA_START=27 /DNA_END=269 /DNA_ORIENTATION=+
MTKRNIPACCLMVMQLGVVHTSPATQKKTTFLGSTYDAINFFSVMDDASSSEDKLLFIKVTDAALDPGQKDQLQKSTHSLW